jgi:hypothetical protein
MADHHHTRPGVTVFLIRIRTPMTEGDAQRREVRVRRQEPVDHLGAAPFGQVDPDALLQRHLFEDVVVLPIKEEDVGRERDLVVL